MVGMLEEIPLGGRCGKKSWFKILMFVPKGLLCIQLNVSYVEIFAVLVS